jgi:DNA processing protein
MQLGKPVNPDKIIIKMNVSNNALNVLTIMTYKGIGKAWIVKNVKVADSIDTIISKLNKDSKEDFNLTTEGFERGKSKLREEVLKMEDFIDGVVAFGDTNFPLCRGKVKNSEQPVCLFYKGDLSLLNKSNRTIAVIGLLNPDSIIEKIEKEVVSELVTKKATIVSGLAVGCDSIAHQQALFSGGKTIAILPSPLNNIIPLTNRGLAIEIVGKGGLLITEYYFAAKSRMELSGRYQERDRLQALFSDAIVLTASYAKNDLGNDSGSRLAMQFAINYSIPRAVIYDSVISDNNPKFDLNRLLITENEADIIIINRESIKKCVNKILVTSRQETKDQLIQAHLFD